MDPADYRTPEQVQKLAALKDAPSFIRDASCLTAEERVSLHSAEGYASKELIIEAKQLTVEEFQRRREEPGSGEVDKSRRSVTAVFECYLTKLRLREWRAEYEAKYGDPATIRADVIKAVSEDAELQDATINDRPALVVFLEQLAKLEDPMLALVAPPVLKHSASLSPIQRWLYVATATATIESNDDAS
jgi:hypothetical protein